MSDRHVALRVAFFLVAAGMISAICPLEAQAGPVGFDAGLWSSQTPDNATSGLPLPRSPSRSAPLGRSHGFLDLDDTIPAPPILRGIELNEVQRAKVSAILNAQSPLLRETTMAAKQALDGLGSLGSSADYDQAKAKALAEAGGRALGELALLLADGEHRIYLLLTGEQRMRMYLQRSARWQ
jgi:LTXXQ motif family protein